jgi:N-acetylmuramoyl-L-alanine amidase
MKKPVLNTLFVLSIITIFIHLPVFAENTFLQKKAETSVAVVVIDAGHGGNDFGATVGTAKEKDIVLDLALKLGNYIKTNYPEIKIIYTRNKDVFIPLYERANIANKNKADLFISIHVNSTAQTNVQGTETFVLGQHRSKENLEVAKKENSVILLEDDYNTTYEGFDPNSPESYIMFELVQDEYLEQSVMFASAIQDQFREAEKRIDRSVKQAGFLVLRRTAMPSVLIEVGFISNARERNYLLSETGKTKLASAIFLAFKEYKKKIEEKSSFTVQTTNNVLPVSEKSPFSKQIITQKTNKNTDVYYTVQIAASQRKLDPIPANFKGEKNIFRKDWEKISRYFSGKFETLDDAVKEKNRLSKKYPESFIVSFENGKLISGN